ncbi:hypothetical protein ACQPW1_10770 [Nocardia sp. CA-128927]|uniref:hypothetical protein n=1 Tax=Nocardia sp. CA-128927 TaxID=3239975 RepID=UPI003D97E42F
MSVRFLGTSSNYDGSPTLFATATGYLVQGWLVQDREDTIEIPHRLLAFLEPGTCLSARLEDTGRGTFLLSGTPVSDSSILAEIEVPSHERCIEVPSAREIRPDDSPLVNTVTA